MIRNSFGKLQYLNLFRPYLYTVCFMAVFVVSGKHILERFLEKSTPFVFGGVGALHTPTSKRRLTLGHSGCSDSTWILKALPGGSSKVFPRSSKKILQGVPKASQGVPKASPDGHPRHAQTSQGIPKAFQSVSTVKRTIS